MTTNSPCDISASEYNRIFQERNNYLQSISVPPYYGTPNAVPERARRCTLQNGSIINLAKGNITQAQYKNDVLSTYNKNTYVASKTERLKRVFNGFTANGQHSAQYGTQNWNYTEADARQSNLLGNNTLTCDIPSGFNQWISVITDPLGEKIIVNQIDSSYYYNNNNNQWYLISTPLSLTNNQYLTYSNNIIYISGANYIYRSIDNGITWDIDNSYKYPKTGIKGIRQIRSLISDKSGEKFIITGDNLVGTTMIEVQYTGNIISLIKDNSRYLPHSDYPNSTNNNVYFTSMDSYQDISNIIWACGYCNQNYIPSRYYNISTKQYNNSGYNAPITGNYVWYSNDGGINWSHGINIETEIIGNAGDGPENQFWTGIDVSLTNIKVSKNGSTVIVSGNKYHLNRSRPNFWINTISGELSGWGLSSSNNGFSNITQAYNWYKIAISANGEIIVASSVEREDFGNTGYIYISRDYGSSVKRAKLPLAVWNSISMSDDGTTIIVSSNSLQFNPNSVNLLDGGYVYISKDTGLTWLKQESQ